jgi:hypothetical protein
VSTSSFIDVNLSKENEWIHPVDLIQSLLTFGWELNDNGEIVYLPLGDDDSYSWKSAPLSQKAEVMAELKKKQDCDELIGVVATYKDTQIGGDLLFLPEERQITFSLSINNKKTNSGISDFDWYKEKLAPWIGTFSTEIENIYFCQSDSGGRIQFEQRYAGTSLSLLLANHKG